tara:strand:- start:1711 stop:2016 length:306 start_codon:yes stop_codon:yes gene_type:complete
MDYNSINTQWYSLEDKDICEVDLKLGHVTFKDKSFNTKSLRMDRDILISSIAESLKELEVKNDFETSTERENFETIQFLKNRIDEIWKESFNNFNCWENSK